MNCCLFEGSDGGRRVKKLHGAQQLWHYTGFMVVVMVLRPNNALIKVLL